MFIKYKCGVYISKCDCGSLNGLDGWSYSRRFNYEKRKIKNVLRKEIS